MPINPLMNTTLPASTGTAEDTPPAINPADREKVERAATKFESLFIGEMLKQMRRTTREMASQDSPFKDRINDDMLDLADGAVADAMAGQRAFGIADAILRQLLPAPTPSHKAPLAPLHAPAKPVALDR